ncbi:hypothetical protein ENSA5_40270 [Enhygromyxa salina]|uniref:Glycosyltransferase RgtA/B/C/D-like domain-containing protein n=1 Tax=Enhygromyxa salina TaxID=215803 RepID=A0A2S9XQ86_9BACT|nr:hypothetical protein [Enhygromyxa salina]PRP95029.1 hypothetical protein ENSA5_40270 [Enhygromyxa salina]
MVFAALVLRHGWMSDDAYISLRTIDNFAAGHGLVWNVGHRVQAFTHPLWLLLCGLVYAITSEFFYSLIIFGALVSTCALAIVSLRLARSELVGISLVLAAALSHAFVDYSTSGLENPLTHLLIGLSAWVYLGRVPDARRFALLCLLGGLALLSRPDNAILLGPVVLAAGVQAYRRGATVKALIRAVLLGGVPLFAWELFSLIYYGLLVPNTALAKLNSGVEAGELIHQGLLYFVATLDADPLTLLIIVAGTLAPFVTRDRRMMPFAIGVILHALYLTKIGGDFMLGRFFTAPMFMALVCLSQVKRVDRTQFGVVTAVVAALGLSAHPNTFEINSRTLSTASEARGERRVTNTRALLAKGASLSHATRIRTMPDHKWTSLGLRGSRPGHRVQIATALGFRGFSGGPEVHWIDNVALSDPLLARLPAKWRPNWMTGHFIRAIPKGYVQTLESGENVIEDPKIHDLYERVSLVTRGDLWSVERFKAIWWLNTGGPARLLNEESWRFHGASKRSPSSIGAGRVPDGTALDSKLVRAFGYTGVYVKYKHRQQRRELELSVNDNDRFEIRFYDGGDEVARVPVPRQLEWNLAGVSARRIALPEVLAERGFTRLRILPRTVTRGRKPAYAVGHLLFDEDIEAAELLAAPAAKPKPKPKPPAKSPPKSPAKSPPKSSDAGATN